MMPSSPHPHSHSQPSPPQPQPQPQPQPPPPQPPPVQTTTVRKLIVEVIDARDLLPKDGQGSSSPYVVVDFDKQRKRTSSKFRDLNPSWNEKLDFIVSDPSTMQYEELVVEVYNDKRMSNASASAKKCHFLGRVKIYGSQFAKRGDEGLIYFALEKKSVFSWIRGEIGLKIYYYDEVVEVPANVDGGEPQQPLPEEVKKEEPPVVSVPIPIHMVEVVRDGSQSPPIVVIEESPPPATGATAGTTVVRHEHPPVTESNPTPVTEYPPEVRKVQNMRMEGDRFVKKPNGDFSPRIITGKFCGETEKIQPFDLVEPMQYLFIKIVKARNLPPNESPCIKIRSGNQIGRPKPAFHKANEPTDVIEWNRVFTLNHNNTDRTDTLEISVWDQNSDRFLGGVCFGLTDVPVRDPPDSPLAPQWYHLEGTDEHHNHGDIQLSVWIGTQADDAFPESINLTSDSQYVSYTRPKVYQSPKLWYLRVIVVEAQDLQVHTTPLMAMEIRVKAQLGFQSVRTRRGVMNNHTASFHWHEDLVFVACEPLEDQLILLVEDRTGRDPVLLGHVAIPVGTIEERLDERHLGTKWYSLEGGSGSGPYFGRLNLRLCLEGGYHVLDEAAHLSSDFRPTARQLWKPPVGILELGILGARGLLPMKSKSPGKGSTDAYCVAKYGKKWVRTRTVTDTFDPRWNEQYTWQVYDPCTVLTIGVFDNRRMFVDMAAEDCQIGKVRIRVSTLETNKVYTNSYPLMVLQRTGLRKIGEIELAVRFASPSILPETCATYGQPILPRMHYLRPLGVAQQEALRHAATKMVAAWLSRSEPPLGSEVVRYILDADSHTWSMRKSKANWFRIVAVLSWAVGLAKWLDDIRRWKNPVTTVLVHLLYLVLVWYPDLIVPTGILYVVLIGVWYHRFRPKAPAGMDIRMSQAEMVDLDELDEEFDTIPSSKPPEIIRIRYDRLRILASRVQTVLGDFATQGERVQALVSWRDPRATRLFIGVCLIVAMILYVVPPKMVAVALGFYYLRHPLFRDPMPPASLNFFRRLPSLSDRLM